MANKMERFSQHARQVLSYAQEEAEYFQQNYIGTEHLLVGLVREDKGLAGKTLRKMGVDRAQVQALVERMSRANTRTTKAQPELSPGVKRILEFAVEHARRTGIDIIDTEHLLLGLVRLTEGVAIDILKRLNISPDEVRQRLLGKFPSPRPRDGRRIRLTVHDAATGEKRVELSIDLVRISALITGARARTPVIEQWQEGNDLIEISLEEVEE
jgi:ATP-dependent Clp protease ATP-binding subunit ClpC